MPFTTTQLHYAFNLTESISAALGVPVELTDARLRSFARSTGRGRVQPGGSAGFRGAAGTRAQPVDVREPLVIPAVPQLGLAAVHVIPLCIDDKVEAVLWLMDVRGDLNSHQLDYAHTVSLATMSALITTGNQATVPHGSSAANAVVALGSPEDARAAIESAVRSGRFSHSGSFTAITIATGAKNDHYATIGELQAHLAGVGERIAQAYAAGRSLVAQYGSECSVLVAAFPREDEGALLERLLSRARDLMYRSADHQLYDSWIVGTSSGVADVGEAAEVVRQSRRAAELGLRLGWRERTVSWSSVRHVSGLGTLPSEDVQAAIIPPRLADFLSDPQHEDLITTLRVFLERAGNIQAVAADLFLHRASVYHRLKRVQQILGVDLYDGHDRLEIHLGLVSWMLLNGGDGEPGRSARATPAGGAARVRSAESPRAAACPSPGIPTGKESGERDQRPKPRSSRAGHRHETIATVQP